MREARNLVAGEWRASDIEFVTVNPATGESIGMAYAASKNEVQSAVSAARSAVTDFQKLSLQDRASALRKMAEAIVASADDLKELITLEMGRPIAESEIEVYETADMLNYFAEEGKAFLSGEAPPVNSSLFPGKLSLTRREALGVVGIIKPWNYPLELPFWSIGAALLAGNSVVLKPSELTPLVGAEIGRIVLEADLPSGTLNIIQGNGKTGECLVDSDIDMISFTGSVETGKRVMEVASRRVTKVSLELGGSDPFLVLDDATLEEAVNGAVWGRFTNCGQVCVSAKRIIVVDDIADLFIDELVKKVKALRIGDGSDPNTDIGPLVSQSQRDRVMSQVEDAVAKGAKILAGGKIPNGHEAGFFYEPTVMVNVTSNMRVLKEEVFGPVAVIQRAHDFEEAIQRANQSDFGLGASVWTTSVSKAFQAAERIRSGTVWINEINVAYPSCPWGGTSMSGFGKELGKEGIFEYTSLKHINVDYSASRTRDWWFPYGAEGD